MTHIVETSRVLDRGRDGLYNRDDSAADMGTNVAARIINLMGGIIVSLLGLRFALALLGANSGNALVNFVYSMSYPFAAPFFGIFNYRPQLGVIRFEFETLIAMAVYGGITWLLIRLVTIGNRHIEV